MEGQKEQEETEGLDDLLDEILQKNMEKEVKKHVSDPKEPLPPREVLPDVELSQEELLADEPEQTTENKPTPEEYLDQVFGDEAEPKPSGKDDDDIRVIEVEVGSEDDTRVTKKDVLSMLAYVVIIFLLTFFIVHYVGQRTRVSGSSMENTLSNGDNLIVDKLSYRFNAPERFDVIIFPFQYEEDTYYIKRIIGLPGETVQIGADGTIYINGEVLEEDYGLETILDPGMAIDPVVLGDDEYFVLGDNRNNSSDSRFAGVGKVKRDQIIGRAWIRIYPFDKIKKL